MNLWPMGWVEKLLGIVEGKNSKGRVNRRDWVNCFLRRFDLDAASDVCESFERLGLNY